MFVITYCINEMGFEVITGRSFHTIKPKCFIKSHNSSTRLALDSGRKGRVTEEAILDS